MEPRPATVASDHKVPSVIAATDAVRLLYLFLPFVVVVLSSSSSLSLPRRELACQGFKKPFLHPRGCCCAPRLRLLFDLQQRKRVAYEARNGPRPWFLPGVEDDAGSDRRRRRCCCFVCVDCCCRSRPKGGFLSLSFRFLALFSGPGRRRSFLIPFFA